MCISHYHNLWKAVIQQAKKDLTNRSKKIRKQAEEWFADKSGDYQTVLELADQEEK